MKIFTLLFCSILLMSFAVNAQNNPPVAVNDTIHLYKFDDTLTVNFLQNDYDPDGDYIYINWAYPSISHTDSTITFFVSYDDNWNVDGMKVFLYYSITDGFDDSYCFVCAVFHNPYFDSLNINKVSARINNTGNHFHDLNSLESKAKYVVPEGSGNSSLYSFGFLAGGLDDNNYLHLAGQMHDNDQKDYFPGPVMDSNFYSSSEDSIWNRLWKLNRTDIEYHIQHWWQSGYNINPVIASWPGNGNPAIGQAALLAPFYDLNNNGVYEPAGGDYPQIKGDQCIFFIINDSRRSHAESGGKKLGIEIHGMAYAYDCNLDSALMYTTFLHYDIYNRSANTYHYTYFGTFTDSDLGYSWDDYVGSDVSRGSFITYNSNFIDGSGLPGEYGAYPPAISTTILAGPFMDDDNIDNPKYDAFGNPLCNYSINGANFGDSIVDNERYGMQSFNMTENCGSGPYCDPSDAFEYYNCLSGNMNNGTPIQYGSSGVQCSFMFPGLTDFCNWGTNGVQPPGYMTGAGGAGMIFDMSYYGTFPTDYRGIIGMGPFTFYPGDRQQLDLAFVWARQYTNPGASAVRPLLDTRIDQVRSYFFNDSTPCGGSFSGIPSKEKSEIALKLFPNPADGQLFVNLNSASSKTSYTIYNIMGQKLSDGLIYSSKTNTLDIGSYPAGFYFLVVNDGKSSVSARFIKR